jgi:hypothetical protein
MALLLLHKSMANKPIEISTAEWKEIMQVPEVKESWGLEGDETPEQFADMVYGVKFHYSGGPGYNGDLYMLHMLHGDAMGEPFTLVRENGMLVMA